MMNKREIGEGFGAARRISNCFKDRDEELSFFRDLQKHDKDHVASLLDQPVSEEFEANGNYGLYRMDSGGRRGPGLEFLAESGKNDYNWLKTPPATPLFPSLEMEANGQQLIIQKEIPIIQPLSRFAGNSESSKTSTNNRSTTPNPKPKLPHRHKTPNGRPSVSSLDKKNMKTAPLLNLKTNHTTSGLPQKTKSTGVHTGLPLQEKEISTSAHVSHKMKPADVQTTATGVPHKPKPSTAIVKSNIIRNESQYNFAAKNLSKSMESIEPNPKISRGVSPFVRPAISGFSNETPPNLRTINNRPSSATRGRPNNQNLSTPQKPEFYSKVRRQSCSPSVTRGRKVDADNGNAANNTAKAQQSGQVLGSRMVDRFMNARISNAEERHGKVKGNEKSREEANKIKLNGSLNESSGFGRLMSKSSLDMALKHMEIQRDSNSTIRKHGMVPARKS